MSRLRLALGAVLALALLALFLRGVQWSALGEAFRSARPVYLLGVVGATVVTYLARAWRWGYLLAPLARVPLSRLFSVTLVGFMAGLVVPRAGELVRPYLIARRYGVRTSAAFASIILERLADLVTVLVLFGLYLYVLPLPAAQSQGTLLGVLKAAGGFAALAALGVLAVLFGFHLRADRTLAVIETLARPLPERLTVPVLRVLRSFGEGLAVLNAPPGHLLAILGQSLVVWLSVCAAFYSNNLAFGVELPFHTTFLLVAFLTVGVAIPTPGMVGGFHEFYLLAMTQAYGIAHGTAAAAGIAAHALSNLPVLVMGLAFLGREGLSFGKVAAMAEEAKGPADGVLAAPAAGGPAR